MGMSCGGKFFSLSFNARDEGWYTIGCAIAIISGSWLRKTGSQNRWNASTFGVGAMSLSTTNAVTAAASATAPHTSHLRASGGGVTTATTGGGAAAGGASLSGTTVT